MKQGQNLQDEMADQDRTTKQSLTIEAAAGVDELVQELDNVPVFSRINGAFNDRHEVKAVYGAGLMLIEKDPQVPKQGALSRFPGKKLIDANPLEKVYAINQAFNGFGQFGYYVQTDKRLYFHTCESPKDLHINFATLQNLGVDADGNSLGIFALRATNTPNPDNPVSCLFNFPVTSLPPLSDVGHKGVDYVIIKVTPQNPTTDARFRTRLISINSGTPYDNLVIGYYHTQNACSQDSAPLTQGADGFPGYPPDNSKTAYTGWGGDVLVNTWTAHSPAIPQIWNPIADTWDQINAPTKIQTYPDNYIGGSISGPVPAPVPPSNLRCLGGIIPGVRYFFTADNTVRVAASTSTFNCLFGTYVGNSILTVNYNFLPSSASQGQTAISGNIIYTYDQGVWVKPYSYSYNWTYNWANAAAREAQNPSAVGVLGKQLDSNTYWRANKVAVWTYANFATLQASSHTAGDVNKFAKETDNNTWWVLAQAGVTINATWSYANQPLRESAFGFAPSDIGKIAHQTDQDSYWTLTNYNRHATKTDPSEYFFINYFRLFQDFQAITPASIQYKLRGYWDKAHGGNGQVRVDVSSFKGGILLRSDQVTWSNQGGAPSGRTGGDGLVASNGSNRSGTDGQTFDDGRGRSGLDGQIAAGGSVVIPNISNHIFINGSNAVGTFAGFGPVAGTINFAAVNTCSPADIGRTVSAIGFTLPTGCVITDVSSNGSIVRISPVPATSTNTETSITLGPGGISNHYISNSANFQNTDLNHIFNGTFVPNGTTIQTVVSTTEIILSNQPTQVGSGLSWTIVANLTNKFKSVSAAFTNVDLGRVLQATNVPVGTTIQTIVDAQNVILSQLVTAAGTGLGWTILSGVSNSYHSESALFTNADLNQLFVGDLIPPNTIIQTVIDAKNITLSNSPTATGSNLNWTIQTQPQNATKTVTVVAANTDAKGKEFLILTISLNSGAINLTDPAPPNSDSDAQTPCPF